MAMKGAGAVFSAFLFAAAVSCAAPESASAAAVVVFGDSLAVGTADALADMAMPGTKVLKLAKNGYGLSQKDAWGAVSRAVQSAKAAGAIEVFVLVGTNDGRGLPDRDGNVAQFGTDAWAGLYAARVAAVVQAFRQIGAEVSLLSVPAPRAASHAAIAAKVMKVERFAAAKISAPVLPIGRIAPADRPGADAGAGLRAPDGIHMTVSGYKEMALACAHASNEAAKRRFQQARIEADPAEAKAGPQAQERTAMTTGDSDVLGSAR